MGKISQGILGGISGKVGNVIGASWKGINYLRIKPASVANPRTEGQVNQRNKFSATLSFLKPNLSFVQQGYRFYKSKQTAMNAAMSYVLRNAIIGTAPDFEVDYSAALLSRGNLTGPADAVVSLAAGSASFSWTDNSAAGNARPDDRPMLLVYSPTRHESVVVLEGIETRADGAATISLPDHFTGESVETFMAFQAADGSSVSDSVYLGAGTPA